MHCISILVSPSAAEDTSNLNLKPCHMTFFLGTRQAYPSNLWMEEPLVLSLLPES
jgi:hypothetical protein